MHVSSTPSGLPTILLQRMIVLALVMLGSVALIPVPSRASPPRVTNLGVESDLVFGDRLLAFRIRENESRGDLNGDGDLLDGVVHVYDLDTRRMTNLGHAVRDRHPVRVFGAFTAFYVDEDRQGSDLNEDGDLEDTGFLYVHDSDTGDLINLGSASDTDLTVVSERWVLYSQQDLLIYDVVTRRVTSTGVAGRVDFVSGPFVKLFVGGVPHVLDFVSLRLINLFEIPPETGLPRGELGPLIPFDRLESHYGMDINGDGDMIDRILHFYATGPGVVVNLRVGSHALVVRAGDNRLAFALERIRVFDGRRGEVLDLGFSTGGLSPLNRERDLPPWDGPLLAMRVRESYAGQDLNGDGDTMDWILHLHDASTGVTTNLGVDARGNFAIESGLLVFRSREFDGDLNGDGDTADEVISVVDVATGEVTSTGLAAYRGGGFGIGDGLVSFRVVERQQGGQDLDGDGSDDDYVAHVYDARSRLVLNLGLTGYEPRIRGHNLIVPVLESLAGADLNGDGDQADAIAHLVEFDPDEAIGASSVGRGAGESRDVLRVNGETGMVRVPLSTPFEVSLDTGTGERGAYVLWVWSGYPRNPVSLRVFGETIGTLVSPSPLHFTSLPQPVWCLRGGGVQEQVCQGTVMSSGPATAPWSLIEPNGLAFPRTLTLQAVVRDAQAANSLRLSVSNAVILRRE